MHTYLPPSRSGDPFTVGFYDPDGTWIALKDFSTEEDAANYVHFLNGA